MTPADGWKRVVWSAECDEWGNCPVCGEDYSECPCPGPTMDGWDYKVIDGELHARPSDFEFDPDDGTGGGCDSGFCGI